MALGKLVKEISESRYGLIFRSMRLLAASNHL